MNDKDKPMNAEIKQQLYGGEITDYEPKLQDKYPYKNDKKDLENIYDQISKKQKNILNNKDIKKTSND